VLVRDREEDLEGSLVVALPIVATVPRVAVVATLPMLSLDAPSCLSTLSCCCCCLSPSSLLTLVLTPLLVGVAVISICAFLLREANSRFILSRLSREGRPMVLCAPSCCPAAW